MKMVKKKDLGHLISPVLKAGLNIPTCGFASAIADVFDAPYKIQRQKNLKNFVDQTIKKVKELDIKISELDFKKRINEPEFIQLFSEILNKIQNETRAKIRQSYSNLLTNLLKEEANINFNKKMFFVKLLESLNEDHIKLLHIFYKDRTVKNRLKLDTLHQKMNCFIKRKRKKGDPVSLFTDDKSKYITVLDELKSSYIESLISDLDSKKLINIEMDISSEANVDENEGNVTAVDSIDNDISYEYMGTQLGFDFYKSIKEYK